MKYNFHIILLCLAGLTFTIGCEKATIQNDTVVQSQIAVRGDCDECPEDDECCCRVQLQATDNFADLIICGSTSGTSTCFGPSNGICPPFAGITYSFTLQTPSPTSMPFCALISGPFWILNTHPTDPASIIITCQDGEITPNTFQITLQPGERAFFENNGDCEIGSCH